MAQFSVFTRQVTFLLWAMFILLESVNVVASVFIVAGFSALIRMDGSIASNELSRRLLTKRFRLVSAEQIKTEKRHFWFCQREKMKEGEGKKENHR